jgi:phosphatidylinositol 4-kinase
MIIHLEADWDDEILERFALVIAQQSVHFSLQLNWILKGALDDYQPESPYEPGKPNPNYNPLFHSRCLKLLKNVERCVVYGKPRAQELQRLYEIGKITKQEIMLLEQADRRFNALQITSADDDNVHFEKVDGWLYVKLHSAIKKSSPMEEPKQSKSRVQAEMSASTSFSYEFCSLDKHVLEFFKYGGACGCKSELILDRAVAMERAIVQEEPKLGIRITTAKGTDVSMRCSTEEEHMLWLRRLREEAEVSKLFNTNARSDDSKPQVDSAGVSQSDSSALKDDLTPAQLNRFEFFQNERTFVDDLTQIAEDLRFCDRAERKALAPGFMEKLVIPPNVYLPLCNSSDYWRRVDEKLPNETRVFNTKERCPTVMQFIAKRGEVLEKGGRIEPNIDVATYMSSHFDVIAEMESIKEEGGNEEVESEKGTADRESQSTHSRPNVWHDDDENSANEEDLEHGDDRTPVSPSRKVGGPQSSTRTRGNKRMQRLLRESVVTVPNRIQRRLKSQTLKKRFSIVDRQTAMAASVPILDGDFSAQGGDDSSVVSTGQSSILIKNKIVLSHVDGGNIDEECISRATDIISGGESWASRSAKMLEKARKQSEKTEDNCQVEISSCLAKSNDDLRQETFVMQMIHFYKSVFAQAKLPLWLKTYRILSTGSSTGLLELLTDATSLDALKKSEGYPKKGGLRAYFEMVYGGPYSESFKAAQSNFAQSLAAYGIVSYLLGLKDRHNGNIMIDTRGHLINIDFGFAMGMRPGHEFSFERAPFKFTKEYVQVLGGVDSDCYKEFERLFVAGFEEARKHSQIALGLVEIMMYKSNYPCFSGKRYGQGQALVNFEDRLMLRVPEHKVKGKILGLIKKARQHAGTKMYDVFQQKSNGYAI